MSLEHLKYGDYSGVDVIYTPPCELTNNQKKKFFSQFSFLYVAKSICFLSKNLLQNNVSLFGNTPYSNDTLCKALCLAIKYANNSVLKKDCEPSREDLEKILLIANDENDKEFNLIVAVNQQLCENCENQIARTWCIFFELWLEIYGVSPLHEIEDMVNVPYVLILGFSWSIIKSGYTFECKDYKEFEKKLGLKVSEKWCENYLNFFSCSRNQWISNVSCPPTYISKPILDSGVDPLGRNKKVYFIPSAKNLISRVTTGLFYDLADKDKEKKVNKFRCQFGKVLEEYVKKIFEFYLDESFVRSGDIEYGTKRRSQKTTDVLIRRNESLVLIEVKQASLYAEALYKGDENKVKLDLKRNIGGAVAELAKTERALNENHDELKRFCGCKEIFKIIVLSNPLHLANSYCKDLLKDDVDLSDVMIMNLYELEMLLDIQQIPQNFFDVLKLKISKYPNYSFKDFIAYAYPNAKGKRTFIKKYLDEIKRIINSNEL